MTKKEIVWGPLGISKSEVYRLFYEKNVDKFQPPPLSDTSPWAQGFNDFMAFGPQANAIQKDEEGFSDYESGKRASALWFYQKADPNV